MANVEFDKTKIISHFWLINIFFASCTVYNTYLPTFILGYAYSVAYFIQASIEYNLVCPNKKRF